ncbi:MAG: single-stranded DNA-binding protein [Candidatus Pacebacteria bacterium]|nr:single-stranded DNA-binding protein [Candidatus Paceibacterota bacterium]
MIGFNKVVLMGNLTRDPQLRHIPSGAAVAEMGMAANESFKNQSGEVVERTCFVDIVAWGRQAESCTEYLKKGAPVLIEGSLQFEQWQTQEGQNRSRLRVRADRVRFLGSRKSETEEPQDGAVATAAAPDMPAPENMPF